MTLMKCPKMVIDISYFSTQWYGQDYKKILPTDTKTTSKDKEIEITRGVQAFDLSSTKSFTSNWLWNRNTNYL